MNSPNLAVPWSNNRRLYSLPDHLVFKLALGEAPQNIPFQRDTLLGLREPVSKVGVAAVDRVLAHYSGGVRITRLHRPAAVLGRLAGSQARFDDLEHLLGLSRTYRLETQPGAPIHHMIDALRGLQVVESAGHHYLTSVPMAAPAISAYSGNRPPHEAFDPEAAWVSRLAVNSPEAMAYEPGDPVTIIAVVDSGVVLDHPELRACLRAGLNTVQIGPAALGGGAKLMGDTNGEDTNPVDEVGHGTSCAAIISAYGYDLPPGLAGECSLLPIRVLAAAVFPGRKERVGLGALADIDEGLKLAVDLGARVFNLSFGTRRADLDPHDPLPHQDVVRYALARGCILVAASGNSGEEEEFLPAAYEGVIAVGAVGVNGRPTEFSTRSPHVALCAPGERVITAGLDGYVAATGTSFAAPFVTAAAALMVSRAARGSFPLDGKTVRQLLVQTAQPFAAGVLSGNGAGLLDAHAALVHLEGWMDQLGFPSKYQDSDADQGGLMNDQK